MTPTPLAFEPTTQLQVPSSGFPSIIGGDGPTLERSSGAVAGDEQHLVDIVRDRTDERTYRSPMVNEVAYQ